MSELSGVPQNTWSRAKDIVAVLVVPTLAWVLVQVGSMARMEIELETLKKAYQDNKASIRYLRDRDSDVSQQIAKLEARFDALDAVLLGLQKTMDKLDQKLARLDERLDRVERQLASIPRNAPRKHSDILETHQ